jgi:metallo-beta-lactamase class B
MKIIFILIFSCLSILISGQNEPALKITQLSGDFYVFTTYNEYKGSRVSSNGLYVVSNEGVIMIDTPWDKSQLQPLLDSIEKKHHKKVLLCVSTHSHEDRTGGLKYYRQKGIKTYTSKLTDSICEKTGENRAEFCFKHDTTFKLGQYSFQTSYAGPGHTKDNIFIWFGNDKVLYGGCAVKSKEATDLGNIKDADLAQWPATLNTVKKKFPGPRFIIPGHQSWSSLKSIDHTLKLLKEHSKK